MSKFNAGDYSKVGQAETDQSLLSVIAGAAFDIFVSTKYHINNAALNFNQQIINYYNNNNKIHYPVEGRNY